MQYVRVFVLCGLMAFPVGICRRSLCVCVRWQFVHVKYRCARAHTHTHTHTHHSSGCSLVILYCAVCFGKEKDRWVEKVGGGNDMVVCSIGCV